MVFSKSVDKILFLYADASRGHHGLLRKKTEKLRPFRAVRVPNASNLVLEKTMSSCSLCLENKTPLCYPASRNRSWCDGKRILLYNIKGTLEWKHGNYALLRFFFRICLPSLKDYVNWIKEQPE